jgi:hypothetical protein
MTQTIDHPATGWSELVLTPTEQNADYLRRIHWWVRLFGIVWIVIPVVATLMAIFFALGILSMASATRSPSAYSKCVADGYGVTECARMYPR